MTNISKGHNRIRTVRIATAERFANEIRAAIKDAENTGEPVVHVKDGRPLTEHGAKLLGVDWHGD